jgi:hypothetical protein
MEITSALQSEQHVKKELARKLGELQERLGELKETVRPTTGGASHNSLTAAWSRQSWTALHLCQGQKLLFIVVGYIRLWAQAGFTSMCSNASHLQTHSLNLKDEFPQRSVKG